MAMVIAFANNQAMTGVQGSTNTISTDPVPLNGNDRVSAMLNVHYLFVQGGTGTVSYQGQVSNDGVNWVDVATLTDNATAATATPQQKVISVNGAFLRFEFSYAITGGGAGDMGGVAFDLHVKLDHV